MKIIVLEFPNTIEFKYVKTTIIIFIFPIITVIVVVIIDIIDIIKLFSSLFPAQML